MSRLDYLQEECEAVPQAFEVCLAPFRQLPSTLSSDVFYHFTNERGFKGILDSGGLRASYRRNMKDEREFAYARDKVHQVLDYVSKNRNLPRVASRLATECRLNFQKVFSESLYQYDAYCACLTTSRDGINHWQEYADAGRGYAIGFDLGKILDSQRPRVQAELPFIYGLPVIYRRDRQEQLFTQILDCALSKLREFQDKHNPSPEVLTAYYRQVLLATVTNILCYVHFVKAPSFKHEEEFRLMLSPSNGSMEVNKVSYFSPDTQQGPYVFIDLRNPETGLMPLREVLVGPGASQTEAKEIARNTLRDFGYDLASIELH